MDDNTYVKPPNLEKEDEYVKPKSKKDDYVKPPKQEYSNIKESYYKIKENPYIYENKIYKDPYENPTYFGTPKVGLKFYINSYLIYSLIFGFSMFNQTKLVGLLFLAYSLFSNYTYSWYADYKKYVGGKFKWFFSPMGTVATAAASTFFLDAVDGDYNSFSLLRPGFYRKNQPILIFIILCVVAEYFKYIINFFIALVSIFTHKTTIRKYNEAVDYNN
ncbi:hypothetical protein HV819_03940 [Anaerococcus sp. AGMB00486]|uniref:Uncharacterized protein n=1 Tax=Anaerococcus faecalis TaxID=2742993 RepID=A0ABX2N925_9FIRM|nr:hypothetical protein [Anaerococcus faecalis]NVF11143.1 hypothetical protein [Anaerococcus faecalis]